jgi:egghead protein (zeste-white 4 protein)
MPDFFIPIIIILNLCYVYFWVVAIYARSKGHIDRTPVSNEQLLRALARHKRSTDPYLFTVQITTKGGSHEVVSRGIRYVMQGVKKYPALRQLVNVEVITEDNNDKLVLDSMFNGSIVPVDVFILPADYQTPGGTQLKARALHYMVEQHRKTPRDSYIIHYDEESVLTEDNLARLVRNLLVKPIGISEGSISYPLEWEDAHAMCRTMESNRPFGCHECYIMMTNPAPLHLHGSNLVVQERLENIVGWDIGQLGDKPLIAEDLVFGLAAFLKFGKKAFGWHGVEMIEQPPFTVKAAYKQRERWVMGALQGVAHIRSLDGWKSLSLFERMKIQTVIRLRVWTYAVGMPVSAVSLCLLTFYVGHDVTSFIVGGQMISNVSVVAIPGLAMWLGSNQLGLWQNLRYTKKNKREKLAEHLRVLVLTPFSGLYDTAGPFVAVIRWACGQRGMLWTPTQKTAGLEQGEVRVLTPEVEVA